MINSRLYRVNMMLNKILTGRSGYLIGFLACFGLVALALWIQTQYHLEPCPLCISQRIVFMGLGVLFLIAAVIPKFPRFFAVLQVAPA